MSMEEEDARGVLVGIDDLEVVTAPSAAERIAAGFAAGAWVDLGGDPIDADVLASLLLRPGVPEDSARVPTLRLRDAHVTGVLDLAFGEVNAAISLERCRFDAAPDFGGACLRTLRLHHCRLPGLSARLATLRGDLRVTSCTVTGTTSLENAEISGSVTLTGSHLMVPGGRALSAGGLRVGGGFVARRGLVVEGEARLVGAQVAGGLLLQGARFSQRPGVALCLDEVVTNRVELSDGFTCQGELVMRSAQISGRFSLYGARLSGGPPSSDSRPVRALRARGLSAGELVLQPAAVDGLVDLSRARVGALRDSEDSWPQHLRLDGFTYDHLLGGEPGPTVKARCRWLAREQEVYRPHPYEQLADYYRRLGHDADARRVLLAKERRRRATRPWPARVGGWLLDGLVGYGYRSELAALWLMVLVVAGTVVFSMNPPLVVEVDRQPHFHALVYTMDLLIPIGAFGLRGAYDPVGWTTWVADGLIAAGWILATALVAGVSRRVGRD